MASSLEMLWTSHGGWRGGLFAHLPAQSTSGATLGRHQARRDDRADAEERAVGKGCQDARGHQQAVGRGERTGEIAGDEDRH